MNTQYKEFAFNCILNLLHRNTKESFLKYKMLWKCPVIKEATKEGGKWVREGKRIHQVTSKLFS